MTEMNIAAENPMHSTDAPTTTHCQISHLRLQSRQERSRKGGRISRAKARCRQREVEGECSTLGRRERRWREKEVDGSHQKLGGRARWRWREVEASRQRLGRGARRRDREDEAYCLTLEIREKMSRHLLSMLCRGLRPSSSLRLFSLPLECEAFDEIELTSPSVSA
ncbi:hypothetical protein ACLOJK_011551 [Asimina triloba]